MEELSREDSVCARACTHMGTNTCVCYLILHSQAISIFIIIQWIFIETLGQPEVFSRT